MLIWCIENSCAASYCCENLFFQDSQINRKLQNNSIYLKKSFVTLLMSTLTHLINLMQPCQ